MRRSMIAAVIGLVIGVVAAPVAVAGTAPHVSAVIPVADQPTGVGFAAGSAWATLGNNQVVRINPATNTVTATIPVGFFPVRAVGGFGAVWVSNCGEGTVSRIDPATNHVVATIQTGACPFDLGTIAGSVWVVNGDDHVSRINPVTNRVVATIPAALAVCKQISFDCIDFRGLSTGAGAVWVTSHRSTVLRIDPLTNRVTNTIRIGPCCFSLRGVGVGFGSVWASVDGLGNLIVRIDAKTLTITKRIRSVQINPGEVTIFKGRVWFGHDSREQSKIEAIDPSTNRTVAAVTVGDFAGSVTNGAGSIWTDGNSQRDIYRISP